MIDDTTGWRSEYEICFLENKGNTDKADRRALCSVSIRGNGEQRTALKWERLYGSE